MEKLFCFWSSDSLECVNTFFHIRRHRIEMVKDLGYQMSFSVFDEASVAEWKGVDLRLANEIPNMDVIVLAVKRVSEHTRDFPLKFKQNSIS